jgi:hypothetical protein
MSNCVEQIVNSLGTIIGATLTDYSESCHAYDPLKNDFHNNDKQYGVTVGSNSASISITKAYTIDQSINVVLTHGYDNGSEDDKDLRDKVLLLHNNMDDILKASFQQKLGLPNLVLNVILTGYEEPEIDEENKIVVLRMELQVTYRKLLL